MTIWIRNRKGEWVRSIDNNPLVLRIHLWLAMNRWWQLIITPKHIVLGIWYGYSFKDIAWFVKRHIKNNMRKRIL